MRWEPLFYSLSPAQKAFAKFFRGKSGLLQCIECPGVQERAVMRGGGGGGVCGFGIVVGGQAKGEVRKNGHIG